MTATCGGCTTLVSDKYNGVKKWYNDIDPAKRRFFWKTGAAAIAAALMIIGFVGVSSSTAVPGLVGVACLFASSITLVALAVMSCQGCCSQKIEQIKNYFSGKPEEDTKAEVAEAPNQQQPGYNPAVNPTHPAHQGGGTAQTAAPYYAPLPGYYGHPHHFYSPYLGHPQPAQSAPEKQPGLLDKAKNALNTFTKLGDVADALTGGNNRGQNTQQQPSAPAQWGYGAHQQPHQGWGGYAPSGYAQPHQTWGPPPPQGHYAAQGGYPIQYAPPSHSYHAHQPGAPQPQQPYHAAPQPYHAAPAPAAPPSTYTAPPPPTQPPTESSDPSSTYTQAHYEVQQPERDPNSTE